MSNQNHDSERYSSGLFDDISDDISSNIFNNREMLQIDYVPSEKRIVGRDEQIEKVASDIGPAVVGKPPNSVLIYGKTGCGKSLVAKHVAQAASQEATERGTDLAVAYIDCQQVKGNSDALAKIGSQINPPESAISFPSRGLSENEYYERVWEVLDEHYDSSIFIFDEVDNLRNDELLMTLSRAGESGSVDIPIGIIGCSNKINFRKRMSERTKSSFGHQEYVFDPYDANEIREILQHRKDAFVEGVLEGGVIPKTAALSAQEHGDARKAIRLLRYAGDRAVKENANSVTETHITEARATAETERLKDLLSGLPPHSKYVILSLSILTNNNPREEWFKTSKILNIYESVCTDNDASSLTDNRVRQLLNELSFLEVTESRRGRGDGRGQYKQHRLLEEPDIVFQIEDFHKYH